MKYLLSLTLFLSGCSAAFTIGNPVSVDNDARAAIQKISAQLQSLPDALDKAIDEKLAAEAEETKKK